METGPSVKLTGHDGGFTVRLNRLFKIASLWLCLYPALALAACKAFYWLKYAAFLDLDICKAVPPKFLTVFYNFTNWDGVNILIHKFFALPIFVALPIVSFCLLFILYESVLAIYFLIQDSRMIAANFARRISKGETPDRGAQK